MNLAIYLAAGVWPPRTDPGLLSDLASRYQRLGQQAGNGEAAVASLVGYVASLNQGRTVDAMLARMKGHGSAPYHLEQLSTRSGTADSAYQQVGTTVHSYALAMEATATFATLQVKRLDPNDPATPVKRHLILARAISLLQSLERAGKVQVSAAMGAVQVPEEINVEAQRPNEAISQAVEQKYRSVTDPEHRKRILARIIEEYCRSKGISPVPPIEYFKPEKGTEQEKWIGYWDGQTLHISEDALMSGDTVALNVAIHETQHAVQATIASKYDQLTPQQRQDMMDGRTPDIFKQHGSSIQEAERFHEAEPHYTNTGPRYPHAPKEIDAGNGVYEWSDQFTPEDMDRIIEETR